MVRAGADDEREAVSLSENLTIAGWPEVGDLSGCKTQGDLKAELAKAYPRENPRVLGNWRGQLWRFRAVMSPGDLIVLRLKAGDIAIGCLTGDYRFRAEAAPGLRHVRAVTWKRTDVPRSELRADLRATLGSLLTVSELRRLDAVKRLTALATLRRISWSTRSLVPRMLAMSTSSLLEPERVRAATTRSRLVRRLCW
ncbi:hypothetical protein B1H18_08810 [Streptomyces tsukubensis]|uniref:Uncharacterized protein n=2 Tax=Streptomyces tsukubensis TaxID=83656 RepID=A0A1V4ABZ5_9ACTN|nr:hypothetical protein B1H18_08810 [Streptomyces tsukubensis]